MHYKFNNHKVLFYLRIYEIKDVHDVVILKDFDVADKKNELEHAEVNVFENLLGQSNVFVWTCNFKDSDEKTVEESPSNHHKDEDYEAFID